MGKLVSSKTNKIIQYFILYFFIIYILKFIRFYFSNIKSKNIFHFSNKMNYIKKLINEL